MMDAMHVQEEHRTTDELRAGLDAVRGAPADGGRIELIVARHGEGERELLASAEISRVDGLVGDTWLGRGNRRTPDGAADPDAQVTMMSARAAALVTGGSTDGHRDRWAEAGDQLYVDLDLSGDNLPAGTRLAVGDAVVEATAKPHTGCAKFSARFGTDAARFVNSPEGRALNLRGINLRVVEPGTVRVGDVVRRVRA